MMLGLFRYGVRMKPNETLSNGISTSYTQSISLSSLLTHRSTYARYRKPLKLTWRKKETTLANCQLENYNDSYIKITLQLPIL